METLTSLLLVGAAFALGLFLLGWGLRGAIKTWRQARNERHIDGI